MTAVDLGLAGWDQEFGWGLIDAEAALKYYTLAGDFTDDRAVNFDDLKVFMQNWLGSNPDVDISPVNGDGIVDIFDFAAFAQDWLDEIVF